MSDDSQSSGYNEMMNRWAKRQRLSWRFWHLWLRPTPYAPPWRRLLGYAWRGLVLLGIIALVILRVAQWKAGQEDYANRIADAVGEKIGARYAVANPLNVAGGDLVIPKFQALAREGAPWKSVEFLNTSFQKPFFYGFHQPGWPVGRPRLLSARLVLADGEEAALLKNKGISPIQGSQIRFEVDNLEVNRFSATWGTPGLGDGNLENTRLRYTRQDRRHSLQLSQGTFRQGWLPDMTLDQMTAEVEDNRLIVHSATLRPEEGNGQAKLAGQARQEGNALLLDLNWQAEEIDLKTWLREDLAALFHGTAAAELMLKGRINPLKLTGLEPLSLRKALPDEKAGVLISGMVQCKNGEIEGIEYLSNLAHYLGRPGLKRLPVTSASVRLQSRAGVFTLEDWQIKCEEDIMITGRAEWFDGLVEGQARIGVRPGLFKKIPELLATHFREEKDGYLWQTIPLRGKADNFTHDAAVELGRRYLEIQKGRLKN